MQIRRGRRYKKLDTPVETTKKTYVVILHDKISERISATSVKDDGYSLKFYNGKEFVAAFRDWLYFQMN